jgi:hypothetical protein
MVSMPKSGATFLRETVLARSRLKHVLLYDAGGRREMELSLQKLRKFNHHNYFSGAHIACSEFTERMIAVFNLRPIIVYRDLFDIVCSLRDHIRNERHEFSMAFLDETHLSFDNDQLDLLIADLIMPWYLKFYASWRSYPGPALWLSYDEITRDTRETLGKIQAFTGATIDIDMDIPLKQSLKTTRLNKGISGRGRSLRPEVKEKLKDFVCYYPHLDLAPIGLGRPPVWQRQSAAAE